MRDPRFAAWRIRAYAALEDVLQTVDGIGDPQLLAAMRHATLLGGKRMRPMLVYATGALYDANMDALDACGASVELIHAYSLVHDDLPAMDDDALRRGRPTVHVAFGEATAILAGDALQPLAFGLLCTASFGDAARVDAVRVLAHAAGAAGMCGGQALDLAATGGDVTIDVASLEQIHSLKTGTLIRASIALGAIAGGAPAQERGRLDQFGAALGLAFQVRDDILDVESDSETLGKTAGKDAAQAKATYPALIGLDASRARLDALRVEMREALDVFDTRADALRAIADYAIERRH